MCPACHYTEALSRQNINAMKAHQALRCSSCGADDLRFKVMLYDDDEGSCITPEHVFEVLEEDLEVRIECGRECGSTSDESNCIAAVHAATFQKQM